MAKTLNEMREEIGDFLRNSPDAAKLWDLITALRGPDSPSERPDMSSSEAAAAYAGRRKRKAQTVEVIRYKAFNGVVGGAARYRKDRDFVELPPQEQWDHFDKHVARAAAVLGVEVRTLPKVGEEKPKGVKAEWVKPKESKEGGYKIHTLKSFADIYADLAQQAGVKVKWGPGPYTPLTLTPPPGEGDDPDWLDEGEDDEI